MQPASAHNRLRFSSPPRTGLRPLLYKAEAQAAFSHLEADGQFEGYASVFSFMDLGHDVVMPGAFRETLSERGTQGVRLLYQHDPARMIGVWEALEEDATGLFVRGKLDLRLPRAQAAFMAMKAGTLTGLSIGYRTRTSRVDRQTGLRRLEAVDLIEISLVSKPLNPKAKITRLKI